MHLEKLNSYPVIAAISVVLSLLVGFGLGSIDSGVSVVPVAPDSAPVNAPRERQPDPASERPAPPRDREPTRESPREDETPPDEARDPADDETPDKPPRKDAEPRKLAEGRVDELVQGTAPESAGGAIEVTVSNSEGQRLPTRGLVLEVRAGSLGWHAVPVQAQSVREERGVCRFHPLFPGEYRVRSTNRNYRDVEKTVNITHNADVRHVDLMLEALGDTEVEFAVQLEGGTIPEQIEVSIIRGSEDTAGKGRFGRHDALGAARGSAGSIPPTNMRYQLDRSGIVKITLNTGVTTRINFTHRGDSEIYGAQVSLDPPPGLSREEVTLRPLEVDSPSPFNDVSFEKGRLEVTLTLNGEAHEFESVNLRQTPDDYTYRHPTSSDGETFVFETLAVGTWYVVAQSDEIHAPFVRAVQVRKESAETFDVRTGELRVIANREPGSPDPEGEMRYRVRLCPMGSGTIERAYNGDLTGEDADYLKFIVPAGDYTVRVDSPENYAPLTVLTDDQDVTMTAGGEETLEFTISAGATLSFTAVDGSGRPVPGVEFLVSFHPAGEVPEDEKSSVRKGGYDGACKLEGAPFGPVYVHVWTSGSDWNSPDHVFQIDLQAYGTKDLGAVVVK